MVLEMLSDRIASPAAVQVLLGNADALAEAARGDGRLGYRRASEAALALPPASASPISSTAASASSGCSPTASPTGSSSCWSCALSIERLVASMSSRSAALRRAHRRLAGEIIDQRREAVAGALDALRRQYPDYVAELEARFLRQSTLRQEMTRYQSLFEEGLISREIYDDLKRGVSVPVPRGRPRFDIGLDTHQLVKRLDILAGLDEHQLERVCRLLRPRFAVPGDQIIRKGERGERCFSSRPARSKSACPERRVRLGSGEFFGEMALLRAAAAGRCRRPDLLPAPGAPASDFERFMRANPEARDEIDRATPRRGWR